MTTTKRRKPKASSTKGQMTGAPSEAGKELEAAEVAELVGEPAGRQSIEALYGTAAIYAQPPQRTSASHVPLSGRVPGPEEPPPALPDTIPPPEGRSAAAAQTIPSVAAPNPPLLARAE